MLIPRSSQNGRNSPDDRSPCHALGLKPRHHLPHSLAWREPRHGVAVIPLRRDQLAHGKFEVRRLGDAKRRGEDGVVAALQANTSISFMLVCCDELCSMRYQNGYFCRAQNPLGKAAEDPLAQPAMA